MSDFSATNKPQIIDDPSKANDKVGLEPERPTEQAARDSEVVDKKQAEDAKQLEKKDKAAEAEQTQKKETEQKQTREQQTTQRPSTQERSGFQKEREGFRPEKKPEQFGHKPNLSPEIAKQREQESAQQRRLPDTYKPEKTQEYVQQLIKQGKINPETLPKDIRKVLTEKFFRTGHLNGSPLHQKLQEQAGLREMVRQTAQQNAEKPMTKGELLQFARLRNQAENKKQIRNILRYELAKAKQQKMAQQVQSIKQQTQDSSKQNSQQTRRSQMSQIEMARQQFSQKISQSASQSKFEKVLQQVLAGSKKAVPSLPDGVAAKFLPKNSAEWNVFFKNMANMNSGEVSSKGKLASMIQALYRGLFQKGQGGQQFLVADFAMSEGGEVFENKFSQLLLNDPKLLEMFKQLNPGDVIPHEIMQKLGSEFEFIKLMNLLQIAALSEEQKAEILKAYRQQQSPEAQKKLEMALLGFRKGKDKKEQEAKDAVVYPGYGSDKKERVKGNTKMFIYMFWAVSGITLALISYILIRHFF
ncbi:MAG: hypothetical protein ABII18_04130 [bacterium]|nr:hypothetical protein [bacterium]MBU1918301.1 hypothetical protein [bacterium]